MLPNVRLLSPLLATLLLRTLPLLGAASCANLPPQSYPPFVEQRVVAQFVVGDDGRLEFPATSRELIVQQLELLPAPLGEHFGTNASRWFGYAPGTEVTLRTMLRVYGGDDSQAAKALDVALRRAQSVARDTPRDL